MNFLYITSHVPHARAYGAQQRVLHLARLLARHGRVSVVLALPDGWAVDQAAIDATKKEFDVRAVFRLRSMPRTGVVHRLRHDLDWTYPGMYGMASSRPDTEALERMMREVDLTWIHTDRTATSFGIDAYPNAVLDADDLMSRGYCSRGALAPGWRRWVLDRRMQWIWRRRESRFSRRFSAVCVCSEEDRAYLGSSRRTFVLPNCFESDVEIAAASGQPQNRLGFLGNLAHEPNADGLDWFLREIWPSVTSRVPGCELRLVGAGTEARAAASTGVSALGWVPDVTAEVATWAGMIVPVRIGSGTRVKIAEAFGRKCPVVATAFGAFGYSVKHETELLIGDTPMDFAAACVRVLTEPSLRQAIADRAYAYYLRALRWDALHDTMGAIVEAVAGGNGDMR